VALASECRRGAHITPTSCLVPGGRQGALGAYRTVVASADVLPVSRSTGPTACQLIRAGGAGGKSIPGSVAGHPRVFVTLTAPSFGAVRHCVLNQDGNRMGKLSVALRPPLPPTTPRTIRPWARPVDPDRYDCTDALIWNALAGGHVEDLAVRSQVDSMSGS
jgi:hypothetical protein